jgi:hypothetical protein
MSIKLTRSESQISKSDLVVLEGQINTKLPMSFKEFYLANNGGVSNKDWWDSDGKYEPVRVKKFKAVAPLSVDDALDTKYVGGCYQTMTSRNVIPATILPFAVDDGGNFFCLDLVEGSVCFFATDCFDSDLTTTENHMNAYRWLTESFEAFLSGLKDESDIDL